jgi:hypothetical protein
MYLKRYHDIQISNSGAGPTAPSTDRAGAD